MAHMIEITNGVANFAFTGDRANIWHGLGTEVNNDMTPKEMQIACGADWTVEAVPSYVRIGENEVLTGDRALVRSSDNKILNTVSDEWLPVQNDEAFEFFSEFVSSGDMNMDTAGVLDGGRIVFATAKLNREFEVFKNDTITSNLLFVNPFKYGSAVTVAHTTVRTVCKNTLHAALRDVDNNNRTAVRMNHRSEFSAQFVKETLGLAEKKFETIKEQFAFLADKKADPTQIDYYLNEVFPLTNADKEIFKLSRVASQIKANIDTQAGAEFGEGTWYSILNAVTFTTDNVLGHKPETRMKSAWFGVNANRKKIALTKALEYATAA